MEQPPIPSPEGRHPQCFNCGQMLDTAASFCPHCGAALPVAGSLLGKVFRIVGMLTLAFFALGLGAAGACFLLFGASSGFSGSGDSGLTLMGLLLVAGAAACIWGAIRLSK
jgi:hypothetical protein